MTDPLSQLRAANPVPDAALDDAALTRSEAVLSDIVDSGSRTPWKAVAAGIGVLALAGGVIPFVNHSEPVAVAEVLTHAGEAAAAQPDAADKGVTSKEYLKRVDTDGSSTATTEYSVVAVDEPSVSTRLRYSFEVTPLSAASGCAAAASPACVSTSATATGSLWFTNGMTPPARARTPMPAATAFHGVRDPESTMSLRTASERVRAASSSAASGTGFAARNWESGSVIVASGELGKVGAGAVQAHADVVRGDAEDLGDLGLRELLPGEESEDLALGIRKLQQGAVDVEGQVNGGGFVEKGAVEVVEVFELAARAIELAHHVACDAIEPWQRVLPRQGVEVGPGALEDIGSQLLSVLLRHATPQKRQDGRIMRAKVPGELPLSRAGQG